MTQENYYTQTANLIEAAFNNLGDSLVQEPGEARENFLEEARLQMAAAHAIATLAAARESRLVAFATLASAASVGGQPPAPEIAQEAYLVAAVGLGLVEDQGDQGALTLEELRAALTGESDPADADVEEDLK